MENSLTLSAEEVEARIARGDQYVVRFKIEPGEDVHVDDLIRGDVVINSSILDDKVLYKSADQLPTYHGQHCRRPSHGITHVIRGEEWLPSRPPPPFCSIVPRLVDTMPRFAHLAPTCSKPTGNGKLSNATATSSDSPFSPSNGTLPTAQSAAAIAKAAIFRKPWSTSSRFSAGIPATTRKL